MSNHKIIKYDINKFNFVQAIKDLFCYFDLNYLHNLLDKNYSDPFQVGKDSSTNLHKIFYDKHRSGWEEMQSTYEDFIDKIIAPIYGNKFLYQKFPTIRFHIPNNLAVGAFHNDSEFNHPEGEVNYILPLTNSENTASVWVESEPGKKDFSHLSMKVGELIEFNGNKLTHGNMINGTGLTRVSMDFRILTIEDYYRYLDWNKTEKGSMTLGTKFVVGEYYKFYNEYVKHEIKRR